MGVYENFAKLTRLMLSNQSQFYIDNQKLDADFLAKYGTVVEEAEDDDEQEPLTDDSEGGSGQPASGDSGEAGQAHATT